jgi:hypothetical protein
MHPHTGGKFVSERKKKRFHLEIVDNNRRFIREPYDKSKLITLHFSTKVRLRDTHAKICY